MLIRDHLNRNIQLDGIPQRIISLVPSQTELLVDLGLEDKIVGITQFCVHPEYLRSVKTRVGGTKKVNLRKIKDLEPDIILCNKEENTPEMVAELEKIAPVHISDVNDLEGAMRLIVDYGELFDRNQLADTMVTALGKKVVTLFEATLYKPKPKVVYFIWKDPYMVVGQETFINSMLQLNRFENMISVDRYPEIKLDELENMELDLILLSTEPYSFEEKHIHLFKKYAKEVRLVDGEYFSWYGSRLLEGFDYFKTLH